MRDIFGCKLFVQYGRATDCVSGYVAQPTDRQITKKTIALPTHMVTSI